MKKAIVLLLMMVLLSSMSYTATASIYDGGLRTVKTISRSGTDDSFLIVGRSGITSELIIQSAADVAPTVFTVSGYAYQTIVTIVNDCNTSQHTRFIIEDFPAAVLADGGYIQPDGDDITLTYEGSTEENVTAMVGTGGDTLLLDYYNLGANSSLNGTLYMGNQTISRDQWWIAAEGDVTYIADHASLDITTNLEISSNIYLPKNPDGEQVIVSKAGAYEVLVDSTPQIIFRLYSSGGGAGYTASGSPSSVVSSTLLAN